MKSPISYPFKGLNVLLITASLAAVGCSHGSSSGGTTAGSGKATAKKRVKPPWYRDISKAPLLKNSKRIVSWLEGAGGWGFGRFQIDFSMHVLEAKPDTPYRSFEPTDEFYRPDCDHVKVPVPKGGALEGERGYACSDDGDCHLIVFDRHKGKLFEMWRANIRGDTFRGGCLAVWDLKRSYGPSGRGLGCSSADAAGLPIAPLLATPDEVAAGEIRHALRFILPNPRIRSRVFIQPATHSTPATSGGPHAPPYGALFRLRADYPVDTLESKGARVIARALQRYGMYLADAGNITLTVMSDRFRKAKWQGLLGPHDLRPLKVTDFEVVDTGQQYRWGDCNRN
jgi:hypothetical protein